MRIGIDGRALTGRYTGDRTYWRNLLLAMNAQKDEQDHLPEFTVYSRLPVPTEEQSRLGSMKFRVEPASNDRLWTLRTFPSALRRDGIDLAHMQYTIPFRPPCPVVTTVHDISFRLYPEWFPRKHRLLLNLTVPASMRRAAKVITDSNSSRRDILRVYRLPTEQVRAIWLAAGPEYKPISSREAAPILSQHVTTQQGYLLSVGVLQPRKNLPLLLEGFARAAHSGDIQQQLVLTGKRGWGNEGLLRTLSKLQIADQVHFTDYVPDHHLPALYSASDAFVYPSLYEGFGLPPLEAMACGTATLVSNAPAMPEIAGDGALTLPVMDSSAWAQAIKKVCTDVTLRNALKENGLRRAAEFSWNRTAEETMTVYRECLGEPAANKVCESAQ